MILRPMVALIFATITYIYIYLSSSEIFALDGEHNITIMSTISQIGATMMGFMLTALAILASISDKPLVKNMKVQGHYDDILNHLMIAALFYLSAFIISLIALSFNATAINWKYFLLAILVGAIVATIQIIYKLKMILHNIN
jgi:hypothetical protein